MMTYAKNGIAYTATSLADIADQFSQLAGEGAALSDAEIESLIVNRINR
jgi:hypothetical protein